VLEHLQEIGVNRVEWLLLTDHHRETLQGAGRLDRKTTRVAAPQREQAILETLTQFRKWYPKLADPYTVHPGAGDPQCGAAAQDLRGEADGLPRGLCPRLPVDSLTKAGRHPDVKPCAVRNLAQVTPHLYMLDEKMAGKNFSIIISDKGRGLLLDCGLFPESVLQRLVDDMKEHLGLKQIDACWISHMHGDHFTLGQALHRMGVKLWTLDKIVDKCEHPRRYDYPALIQSYRDSFDGVKIDRPLRDGEVIEWEGYSLHIDWMPGQTEFGNCLWLELDGKRIAFTGDNLFGNPADLRQNGHECVVARNSAVLEEGYLIGSAYLQKLRPDIIMGAHSVLMTKPAAFVDRYHDWAQRMIRLYQDMLPDPEYGYLYDPYWVSAYPYRVDVTKDDVQTIRVTVRNFRGTPQQNRVALKLPPGLTAEPAVLEGVVGPRSRQSYPVALKVTERAALAPGVQIVPFDITLDGKRYGELFDFLILGRDQAP
jgi:glyoxylase-like metal-dependent hydrolase (beta-lactamase superfamily II)